jgi:hypothetical protein
MTPKGRMSSAMSLGRPDTVPVMCQLSIGHMLLQTGLPTAAFWNTAEVFAEGLLALRRLYGFDGILVSLHGHDPAWEKRIIRLEKGASEEVVYWQNGDRTVFPPDDLPLHFPAVERPAPFFSDLDPGAIPEEVDSIPVSLGLDFPIDPEHRFDSIDLVVAGAGTEFSVHGEVTSPFDYFLRLCGHTQGLISLLEEPDRSKAILERYTEGIIRLAAGLVDHGVDAVKVSSPYAGSGFISPRFYREFVAPYEGRVARAVRQRGIPAYVHTCGKVGDRLEMMVEAGFSGIECLDPPPLGDVELADAKRRIGGLAFIKGNVDPVNVLLSGTAESVREDARLRLEAGMPGGGYILSTACSVAPYTPRENVQVLAEAAREFGRY